MYMQLSATVQYELDRHQNMICCTALSGLQHSVVSAQFLCRLNIYVFLLSQVVEGNLPVAPAGAADAVPGNGAHLHQD
jgi:hypothetical protein